MKLKHISRQQAIKRYCELIHKRIKEPISINAKGVCEIHHIIPKCVLKNTKIANSKMNLISLYIHEHFLAHFYLSIIFPDVIGVQQAFYLMSNMKGRKAYLDVEQMAEEYEKAKRKIYEHRANKTYAQLYGPKNSEIIKIKQKKSKLDQMIRFISVDK